MKHWDLILDDPAYRFIGRAWDAHSGERENFQLWLLRRIAHSLLDKVPDEGLPEAYETLKDMCEFYISRSETRWHPPLAERNVWINPMKSYDRPEFPISGD